MLFYFVKILLRPYDVTISNLLFGSFFHAISAKLRAGRHFLNLNGVIFFRSIA